MKQLNSIFFVLFLSSVVFGQAQNPVPIGLTTTPWSLNWLLHGDDASALTDLGASAYVQSLLGHANANELRPDFQLGVINVKDDPFLATGDGVTDDTAAIQAAITAAAAAGGGIVWIPQGTYKITSTLSLPSLVTLRGTGLYSSIIELAADIDGITTSDSAYGFGIENVRIRPAESLGGNTTQAGIKFGTNNANFHLDVVQIAESSSSGYRCANGLELGTSWVGHFKLVQVAQSADYGLLMTSGQAHEFSGCDFGTSTGTAASIAGNSCNWSNCKFQGSGTCTGISLSGEAHTFLSPWIEVDTGTASTCLELVGSSSRNTFIGGTYTTDASGLHIDGKGIENMILNPKIVGGATPSIVFSVAAVYNMLIGGNVIASEVTPGSELSNTIVLPKSKEIKWFYDASTALWWLGDDNSGLVAETGVSAVSSRIPAGFFSTIGGGSPPFDSAGNLIIKGKNLDARTVEIWTGTTPARRIVVDTISTNLLNVYPLSDNSYYLGKNDDDSPLAWKGLILKDQTNGKYYRLELNNGSLSVVDLTD